jgi:hypothetical protein
MRETRNFDAAKFEILPSGCLRLPLRPHDLIHRHHDVVIAARHDPERPAHEQNDDQDTACRGRLVMPFIA